MKLFGDFIIPSQGVSIQTRLLREPVPFGAESPQKLDTFKFLWYIYGREWTSHIALWIATRPNKPPL